MGSANLLPIGSFVVYRLKGRQARICCVQRYVLSHFIHSHVETEDYMALN